MLPLWLGLTEAKEYLNSKFQMKTKYENSSNFYGHFITILQLSSFDLAALDVCSRWKDLALLIDNCGVCVVTKRTPLGSLVNHS